MRVGIIGTGIHSLVHLAGYALTPHIEVVAVTDLNRQRAEEVAASHGRPQVFSSAQELIACPEVDLVDVITPPMAHREPVLAVLAAGKPLLCEKPLSLDPAEAAELEAAARSGTALAATSFNRRFDPAIRYLRDLLADGFLGEHRMTTVTVITAWEKMHGADASGDLRQWLRSPDTGGGFLRGAMPHYVDLLRYLLGETTVSAAALQSAKPAATTEGAVSDDIVLAFGSVATGGLYSIAMTWTAASEVGERWSLVGSERTVVVEPDGSMTSTDASGQTSRLTIPSSYISPAVKGEHGFGFGAGSWAFAAMMDHLAGCVSGDNDTPLFASLADGARNAELIADIYRLAST